MTYYFPVIVFPQTLCICNRVSSCLYRGLWQTHLFVFTTVFTYKMRKDRMTFTFLMCFVKHVTFPTLLTCNHTANKLAAVANAVLCVQQTSLRLLSLWPCTWTSTLCFFLQANHADVCAFVTKQQWFYFRESWSEAPLPHKTPHINCGFVCLCIQIICIVLYGNIVMICFKVLLQRHNEICFSCWTSASYSVVSAAIFWSTYGAH